MHATISNIKSEFYKMLKRIEELSCVTPIDMSELNVKFNTIQFLRFTK
jgi:hypothetical protein